MSDYRQQQELQEHQEWLERLEAALKSDNEADSRAAAKQLQEYIDAKLDC